jgi:hypothetical protein
MDLGLIDVVALRLHECTCPANTGLALAMTSRREAGCAAREIWSRSYRSQERESPSQSPPTVFSTHAHSQPRRGIARHERRAPSCHSISRRCSRISSARTWRSRRIEMRSRWTRCWATRTSTCPDCTRRRIRCVTRCATCWPVRGTSRATGNEIAGTSAAQGLVSVHARCASPTIRGA